MEEKSVFTRITEETAKAARDTVHRELGKITDGKFERALELAKAYFELDSICKELEKTP